MIYVIYLAIGLAPQPYSSCTENIFAAVPGDCTQYMQCLWGKYEVFQCAPGLHWNSVSASKTQKI